MDSLPTIVPADTAVGQDEPNTAGTGPYYECKEHHFYVAGEPAEDGSDWYIDEQIDEHERMHAEEARARGAQPAIALDGDTVVFGEIAAEPTKPQASSVDLYRAVVRGDLELLADHAQEITEARAYKPGAPEWNVLRTATDAAMALSELLDASNEIGIEGRDVVALSEHALSVLGSAVAVVEDLAREAAAA